MPANYKVAFTLALTCASFGWNHAQADGVRCLEFGPKTVGELYLVYPEVGFARTGTIWPARGKVCIPTTGDIVLDLKPSELNNEGLFKSEAIQLQTDGLSLVHTNATDRWCSSVTNLPHLRLLRLDGLKITDKGLPALTRFKSLQMLGLRRTAVTGSNLSVLRNLPLRTLNLGQTRLTQSTFDELAALHSLQELDLEFAEFTWLRGKSPSISDASCAPLFLKLQNLPNLHVLNLSGLPIGRKSFAAIASLPRLDALRAASTGVESSSLALLKRKQMTNLNVNQCHAIDDSAMITIASMPNMKVLMASRTQVTNIGVARLKTLSELRMLDLSYNHLKGCDLSFLKNATHLVMLDASGTGIDDRAIQALSSLRDLDTLILSENALTDASIKPFTLMKGLRMLDVSESKITAAGFDCLRKALPKCKIIGYPSED